MDDIELRLHLPQRDQGKHWLGVLVRAQVSIGPQLIGRLEQTTREVLKID